LRVRTPRIIKSTSSSCSSSCNGGIWSVSLPMTQ
jgi:hypothetical protein